MVSFTASRSSTDLELLKTIQLHMNLSKMKQRYMMCFSCILQPEDWVINSVTIDVTTHNTPQYSTHAADHFESCQWFPDITMFELNFCYFHYLSLIKVNSRCAHLPSPWGNRGVFSQTSHSGCLGHYSSALHPIDQSTSARGSKEKTPETLYLFPRALYWGLLC